MCPFQGQGANMAMVDGLKLAQFFGELVANPRSEETTAEALERDIVTRGRKAVLESSNAARQFHTTSRLLHRFRNVGFQIGNIFIRMATRKQRMAQWPVLVGHGWAGIRHSGSSL
jgi:2-polyprenyl-6-methoxyphenol hydroxylase-like FAD-dependent oxidoreductase